LTAELSDARGKQELARATTSGSVPAPGHRRTVIDLMVLSLPVLAYFWLIWHYSVNMIFSDQWSDISLLTHPVTLSALWAQHNENRILFPNLVVLALRSTTHFNIKTECFLSGVLLTGTTALIIAAHRRRSPSTALLFYLPAVLILFSFVQAQNTLWGFQMAWYMVLLAAGLTIFLIDRPTLSWPGLALAMAAAVTGSFSSLQGLFIWPACLGLLILRRRPAGVVAAWVAAAVTTVVVYLYHFDTAASRASGSYPLTHPVKDLQFFFFVIGDVTGGQIRDILGIPILGMPNFPSGLVEAVGVVIFAIAAWVLVAYLRRDAPGGSAVGVALIVFGVLSVAAITWGRISSGPIVPTAGQSRFTVFTLIILAGSYLAVLERPGVSVDSAPIGTGEEPIPSVGPFGGMSWVAKQWKVARLVTVIAIGTLSVAGLVSGLDFSRSWYGQEVAISDITANMATASNRAIQDYVYAEGTSYIRPLAQMAQEDHLSLFGTGAARLDRIKGLPSAELRFRTHLLIGSGTVVSGTLTIVAKASKGAEQVDFILGQGPRLGHFIAEARPTGRFWMAQWSSMSVSNGTYSLASVAHYPGRSVTSSAVSITIRN
jgi:hypothetical protein